MRAESATAVLGSFIVIALVIGTLSYPAHPPAETLLAPDREKTLDTTSPVILWTSPAHGQEAYPNADVVIQFNESMNTSSFSYEFLSGWDPGMNWSWESSVHENDTVRGTHDILFGSPADYEFNVTYAEDLAGNPLAPGPMPNPWNWSTIVVIVSTDPARGETDVPLDKDIIVEFSGPVDGLLPVPFWNIIPDPGGAWLVTWIAGDTIVVLSHGSQFLNCVIHAMTIHLNGTPFPSLVPNPWIFSTVCRPRIIDTDPYSGQMDVPLDYNITVWFSEPMDTGSVVFQIMPVLPVDTSWSVNDTVLTISHAVPFLECEIITVEFMFGKDKEGNDFIPGPFPNPWSFMTVCVNPTVLSTYPPDGGTGVPLEAPIMINFSEPMEMTSVSLSIDPDPGGWEPFLSTVSGTSLSWNHTNDYATCTLFTVTIHTAKDLVGLDLVPLPYVWSFLTVCPNPYVVLTVPAHDATDVELNRSVEVEFSQPMDTATVTWTIDPDPGGWSQSWVVNDTLLVLSHASLFDYGSTYTFEVTGGQDKDGYPLITGPVPNPWSWTTRANPLAPPTNLSAFLSGPSLGDVTVTWQLSDDDFPGGNVSHYDVHRGDVYDGDGAGYGFLGSVPSGVSQYVDQLAGQDANSHYYFVCSAKFSGEPSCSEDQAGKFTRPLTPGPSLVSIPLIPSDESIETVLQTVKYDVAWHYDPLSGEWRWHMTAKQYGGLTNLNHTMGLWVNVTEASSLTVAGMVPAKTTIHLRTGWNLVSFPSFNSSYTVADLKAELPVERVEGFDPTAPPHFLRVLQDSDVLLAGEGYWVKVSTDVTWVVFNG